MKSNRSFERLDSLHLEYESLLVREIDSMIGLAYAHGWRSDNYEKGKMLRKKLREAGSKMPDES